MHEIRATWGITGTKEASYVKFLTKRILKTPTILHTLNMNGAHGTRDIRDIEIRDGLEILSRRGTCIHIGATDIKRY